MQIKLRHRLKALHDQYLNKKYSRVWNSLARDGVRDAILGVSGVDEFESAAIKDVNWLKTIIPNDSVVLDFGCGIGRVEKYLAEHCREAHAVDISKVMLKLAKQRLQGLKNISFHLLQDVSLSIFTAEMFDVVFSLLVLQHLEYEDAFRFMLEFNRVLKPDGICILQFPNMKNESYFSDFKQFSSQKYEQRSLARTRLYTEEEVGIKLSHAGFKIVDIEVDGSDIVAISQKVLVAPNLKELDTAELERQRILHGLQRK